jgi:hypothetical protein
MLSNSLPAHNFAVSVLETITGQCASFAPMFVGGQRKERKEDSLMTLIAAHAVFYME